MPYVTVLARFAEKLRFFFSPKHNLVKQFRIHKYKTFRKSEKYTKQKLPQLTEIKSVTEIGLSISFLVEMKF